MSDDRLAREIDDEIMEALLSLTNFAITNIPPQDTFFRDRVRRDLDVIKAGVAELVRRAEDVE